MIRPAPIPRSYWLPDGRILAGEYPGHFDPDQARMKVGAFLDAGVTAFLDLTDPGDGLEPYEPLLAQAAAAARVRLAYCRDTIVDMGLPSPAQMTRILDQLDAWLGQGHTPYVHCWGGIGRTGTVVGCWLVRSGMTGDEALATVQRLYETTGNHLFYPQSPQTVGQRGFVRGWGARRLGGPAARQGG